jgi:hypothetical protein
MSLKKWTQALLAATIVLLLAGAASVYAQSQAAGASITVYQDPA